MAITGQLYDDAPPAAQVAGETGRLTISPEPYTDRWGTFLSSFAAIQGRDGDTVGVVGVDLSLATLNRQLRPPASDARDVPAWHRDAVLPRWDAGLALGAIQGKGDPGHPSRSQYGPRRREELSSCQSCKEHISCHDEP